MVAIPQDLLPDFRLLFGRNDTLPASIDARSLKRVYRRRALDTHPDRARATGADPAHLTRLFQELNVAYDRLLEFVARSPSRVGPPARPARPAAARPGPAPARPRGNPQARPRPAAEPSSRAGAASAPRERPPRPGAQSHDHAHAGPKGSQHAGATRSRQAAHATADGGRPDPGRASTRAAGGATTADAGRHHSGRASTRAAGGAATAGADRHDSGRASTRAAATDHFWGGRVPNRPLLLGQFLYYSGRISFRALIGAIHWQRSQRPYLGQLAVELGYLASDLVHGVLTLKRFEERFGDAAVRLGVLTHEQRDRLLALQRCAQRPFGQYFVDAGMLHPDDLQRAVVGQHQHNFVRAPGRAR